MRPADGGVSYSSVLVDGRRVGVALIDLAAIVLVCLSLTGAYPRPARADGDEPQYADFYSPPDPLPPGQPGDLIRTEPSRLVLEPSGQLGAILATGTRIMYRSTDARGNPIAVTGTYFEPDNPWPGKGPRPLISYAPGTHGQGNQCAPSRMFNQGIHYSGGWDIMFNYEELFVATMVARGFAIVMTDYEGLGTPPMHTYVNRLAEGQAVLDAARAAMRLPGTSLDPHGPVAFWGYSQGGGATASAAELGLVLCPRAASWWAPMPARRRPTSRNCSPTPTAACSSVSSGTRSTASWPPIPKPPMRSAPSSHRAARRCSNRSSRQCVGQTLLDFTFRHLQPYFTEDINQLVNEEPFNSLLELQRIGRYKPNAPVLINSNRYDPLVPWTAANQLGRDWCAQGADVEFRTNEEPPFLNKLIINHALPMLVDGEPAMQWIAARFNGEPTTPNCGQF